MTRTLRVSAGLSSLNASTSAARQPTATSRSIQAKSSRASSNGRFTSNASEKRRKNSRIWRTSVSASRQTCGRMRHTAMRSSISLREAPGATRVHRGCGSFFILGLGGTGASLTWGRGVQRTQEERWRFGRYLGNDRGLSSYSSFRNDTQLCERGKQGEREKARLVGKTN